MGLTYANAPKDSWLLVVLATISPGHAFFTKGYVPEHLYHEPALVDNTDGFLTGLPLKVRVAQKVYYQPANLYPNGVGSGQYGNSVASGQISNGVASGQISSSIPSDDNNKHAANPQINNSKIANVVGSGHDNSNFTQQLNDSFSQQLYTAST